MDTFKFTKENSSYTIVKHWIRKKLGVSILEYAVLNIIYLDAMKYEACSRTKKELSEHLGVTEPTIYTAIKKLEGKKQKGKKLNEKEQKVLVIRNGKNELVPLQEVFDEFEKERPPRAIHTKIYHLLQKKLEVSNVEYCFLDMIFCLTSPNKACHAGKKYFAEKLVCEERYVFKMIEKLIKKKLLEKGDNETGELWLSKKCEPYFLEIHEKKRLDVNEEKPVDAQEEKPKGYF